jgi:catechol 2,3-dioxygenase-like lactoylglutathione lyase family enzyme
MATIKQRVVPALRITNYARSKAFYIDGLGFGVEWEHRFEPHFPVFMSISRDGMEVFLSELAGDCQVGGLVHFYVPDVDACYAEFRKKQIAVKEPPNESMDGMRDMTVVDPDGNQLRFITLLDKGRAEAEPTPDRGGT